MVPSRKAQCTKHFTACAPFEVHRGSGGILGIRYHKIDLGNLGEVFSEEGIFMLSQILKFMNGRTKKGKEDTPTICTGWMKAERGEGMALFSWRYKWIWVAIQECWKGLQARNGMGAPGVEIKPRRWGRREGNEDWTPKAHLPYEQWFEEPILGPLNHKISLWSYPAPFLVTVLKSHC